MAAPQYLVAPITQIDGLRCTVAVKYGYGDLCRDGTRCRGYYVCFTGELRDASNCSYEPGLTYPLLQLPDKSFHTLSQTLSWWDYIVSRMNQSLSSYPGGMNAFRKLLGPHKCLSCGRLNVGAVFTLDYPATIYVRCFNLACCRRLGRVCDPLYLVDCTLHVFREWDDPQAV